MFSIRGLALGGVFAAIASVTGCYAASQSAPVVSTTTVTSATSGYEPAYFDGYVVFYGDDGRPYYYGPGAAVVWVPTSSSYYEGLKNHYRVSSASYGQWYASTGFRYHAYRGPAGHYYYQGYVRF